jgi:TolB-like protein
MRPAKDEEYFSDGLSEQLINDLAKVSGLKVVGRSSAFQFKGKNEDLRELSRKLGVANVLEGSVRREGNRLRITAALIKANDGFRLWSQTYDRELNDIFAVQNEIAGATTEVLQLKLLGSNDQPVASNLRSANPEAYQAYLQASYFIGRGQSKEDLGKALAYTDRAIHLDEKYAPAWALRASVQNMMAQFGLIDCRRAFERPEMTRSGRLRSTLPCPRPILSSRGHKSLTTGIGKLLTPALQKRLPWSRATPKFFVSVPIYRRYWATSTRQLSLKNRRSPSTLFVPILT